MSERYRFGNTSITYQQNTIKFKDDISFNDVQMVDPKYRAPRTQLPIRHTVVSSPSRTVTNVQINSPIVSNSSLSNARQASYYSQQLDTRPIINTNTIYSKQIIPLSPQTSYTSPTKVMTALSPVRRPRVLLSPTPYVIKPINRTEVSVVRRIPIIAPRTKLPRPNSDMQSRYNARIMSNVIRDESLRNNQKADYMYEIGLKARETAHGLYPLARNDYLLKVSDAYERDPNQAEITYEIAKQDEQQNGPMYGSLQSMLDHYNQMDM